MCGRTENPIMRFVPSGTEPKSDNRFSFVFRCLHYAVYHRLQTQLHVFEGHARRAVVERIYLNGYRVGVAVPELYHPLAADAGHIGYVGYLLSAEIFRGGGCRVHYRTVYNRVEHR